MNSRLRRWVERRPLLWMAGTALAAVLVVDGNELVGGILAFGLVGALTIARVGQVLVASLVVALAAGVLHDRSLRERERALEWIGVSGMREMEVLEVPNRRGMSGWSSPGRDCGNGVKVWLEGVGRSPEKGAVVQGRGEFRRPRPPENPGGFDRAEWLFRQDMALVFRYTGPVVVVAAAPSESRLGQRIKAGFRQAVTRGLEPTSREAMVIRAVVLGELPRDEILIEPFRLTGTLHVFAVSGLHVAMVGLLGWGLLRFLGVPHRAALIPILVLVFGYAWVTGMKPPAVRAAWMAAVVMGAFAFRRRPDAGNALGLAALLVLLGNADRVFSVGVQLSFGVVLAILVLHRAMARCWAWIRREEPYLPRSLYGPLRERWLQWRRWLADGLAVSSSAWLGSAPLTAGYFGIVTPISVVASLGLSLVVLPLLGLALLSAAGGWIPGWSERLNQGSGWLAKVGLRVAEGAAALPGAYFEIPRDRPADEFLCVFDLGRDGAACWSGKSGGVMIDGASGYRFESQVLPAMRRMGMRPNGVVATHPDGRHIGGLIEAVDAFPVQQALLPVSRALGSTYRDWLKVTEDRGVRRVIGQIGVRYPVGEGAELEVLRVPDPRDWHRLADERVMPVRLIWRGWKILFVADQGWSGEQELMAAGVDLKADVIVAGRHLHDNSLGDDFLAATGAKIIIAGHEEFPKSERIPDDWRRACEGRGIAVFHQGACGAVIVTATEQRLTAKAWLGGRVETLER
ncbi:ComEC/Rec2-related protein [Haloferula luteola]|uniref:ComEC/Rec2-related protein n=1 Tax=Haloferula luteola TaxID=595692 RepID=A0A840V420_9BACT|nr:ComEC/Rec2 family competence protein [Haloferula luteola]MBB5352732.1 ComEC/Rec2-related protein [Haloferula luteola]